MGKYRLKAKDLRQKDLPELRKLLLEQSQELISLRQKAASGSIDSPARIREIRKNIARILTIMAEKERQAASEARATSQSA